MQTATSRSTAPPVPAVLATRKSGMAVVEDGPSVQPGSSVALELEERSSAGVAGVGS